MTKKYICDVDFPVAETAAGKVRGYYYDGVFTFQGIKYANAKRFMMPEPVEPWEGIKDATNYGFICPVLSAPMPNCEQTIPHCFWPENEDCQFLNVWTPALDKDAKKPVMVWLHGGGFNNGSSVEQAAYEGYNLAKNDDVVLVSLNHRLNVFGYLDLSEFGEKYHNSGNVGIADIVAALKWVQANIAAFGGDPQNVTIFGQSGGGRKVNYLGQIPEADGLFHKSIIMSGTRENFRTPATGTEIAKLMMEELKITTPEELETVPTVFLIAAVNAAEEKIRANGSFIKWEPVKNDWFLGDPATNNYTEHHKTIPTMIGNVLSEHDVLVTAKKKKDMTREEGLAEVRAHFGEYAEPIIEAFDKAYPEMNPVYACVCEYPLRNANVKLINKRNSVNAAPTYSYIFKHCFDYESGRGPWHCSDIPFFFHNADKLPLYQGDPEKDAVERVSVDAFVNFARTGDPNGGAVPTWEPCETGKIKTILFDADTKVKENHDLELIRLITEFAGQKPVEMPAANTARTWRY